jgi:hypothetical protein
MRRAPFFALAAAFLLCAALMHRAWDAAIDDVSSSAFWLVVTAQIAAALVAGTGFGSAAAARSRDAFGNRFAGLLAVVPVANLVLFLARSRTSPTKAAPVLAGAFVLGGGALALTMAAMLTGTPARLDGTGRAEIQAPPADAAPRIDALIRHHGLDRALTLLAEEKSPPASAAAGFAVLSSVDAEGGTLRFTHQISANAWFFDNDFRREFVDVVCASAEESAVLRAGGRIEHRFASHKSEVLGSIVVTRLECPELSLN